MNNKQKWFVLICLSLGLVLGRVIAQEQQSGGGGSSVTVTSGSITATQSTGSNLHVDVDTAPTTAVTGTFWQATQPVSIATVPALIASSAIIGKTVPVTSCGTTVLSSAWAAVPTSSTAVASTTTCVYALIFNNTNASAQTVTVTDGQGSPVTVVSAFSIPANSQVTFPFYGTAMTTGIKWTAGGTGVNGAVIGVQ